MSVWDGTNLLLCVGHCHHQSRRSHPCTFNWDSERPIALRGEESKLSRSARLLLCIWVSVLISPGGWAQKPAFLDLAPSSFSMESSTCIGTNWMLVWDGTN